MKNVMIQKMQSNMTNSLLDGVERAGSDLANIVTGPRRVTERVVNKSQVNL